MHFKSLVVYNCRAVQLAEAKVRVDLGIARADAASRKDFDALASLLFQFPKHTKVHGSVACKNSAKTRAHGIFEALIGVGKFIKRAVQYTGQSYSLYELLTAWYVESSFGRNAAKNQGMCPCLSQGKSAGLHLCPFVGAVRKVPTTRANHGY